MLLKPAGITAALFFSVFFYCPHAYALDIHRLSEKDRASVDSILSKTEVKLEKMQAEGVNPNRLQIEGLKKGLSLREKRLIRKILKFKPQDLGAKTPAQREGWQRNDFVELKDQPVMKDGKPLEFRPPIVSRATYAAYEKMMQAMEKDTGKRLYIESGHRSRGYHLYNFIKYLREHDYSLTETAKLNALPGYSEHNLTVYHAIDLISADGINGEPKVEDYENLAEHQWMLKHAEEFGFSLTYPRGNPYGIDFEPWHWRVTKPQDK